MKEIRNTIIFLAFSMLFCNSCKNKKEQINLAGEELDTIAYQEVDSMVNTMVAAREFQSFLASAFIDSLVDSCPILSISEELVFDSLSYSYWLARSIALIMSEHNEEVATHCLGSIIGDSSIQYFILINDNLESHYSPSIDLWYTNEDNKLQRKTLYQQYGSEQMDYLISSKILPDTTIVITKETHFRYIHGVGEVDSSEVAVVRMEL